MRPTAGDIALGEFLRSRRGALCPEDVDVPTYGRRRVSGLRREEVAFLAGVSSSYYTRIEQGTAGAVSASVLTALADALRFDLDDRAHLARLARGDLFRAPTAPQVLLPSISAAMSHVTDDTPVAVLGRGMRVLAWNRLAQQVFAPHRRFDEPASPSGVNWVEVLLLDPSSRRLFADWPIVVEDAVGRLRVDAARWPDDPSINDLVARLAELSPDFRNAWERHPTRERPLGGTVLEHPVLGHLELNDTVLRSVEDEDQRLIVFHCEPGSPTEKALRARSSPVGPGRADTRRAPMAPARRPEP